MYEYFFYFAAVVKVAHGNCVIDADNSDQKNFMEGKFFHNSFFSSSKQAAVGSKISIPYGLIIIKLRDFCESKASLVNF